MWFWGFILVSPMPYSVSPRCHRQPIGTNGWESNPHRAVLETASLTSEHAPVCLFHNPLYLSLIKNQSTMRTNIRLMFQHFVLITAMAKQNVACFNFHFDNLCISLLATDFTMYPSLQGLIKTSLPR
jgi:hypothetical protein